MMAGMDAQHTPKPHRAPTPTARPAPRPLRVYVAGPYSTGDPEANTAAAIAAGNELLDAGYAPLVPHLSHYWHTHHTPRAYEDWMRIDLAWITAADAVLRLPGASPGADREVVLAAELGIPIYASVTALRADDENPP